jgi:hypothetical protein
MGEYIQHGTAIICGYEKIKILKFKKDWREE